MKFRVFQLPLAGAPFAGALTGTGGVTKTGTGSLILSGSNTYTGTTMVTGGTLSVTGALGNTTVTVASGSTLAAEDPYGSGGDVLLTVTTVPEPTSLSLLALRAAGLLARRRRRVAVV